MTNLCDSCRIKWDGQQDEWCNAAMNLADAVSGGFVVKCSKYTCGTIIEREDDGTERCGYCGKNHWGWDKICPVCGADYRR